MLTQAQQVGTGLRMADWACHLMPETDESLQPSPSVCLISIPYQSTLMCFFSLTGTATAASFKAGKPGSLGKRSFNSKASMKLVQVSKPSSSTQQHANLTPRYDDQPCIRIPSVTPTAADALLHLQDVIIITSSDDDSDSEEPAANGKAAAMNHSSEAPADGAQKVRHRHTP